MDRTLLFGALSALFLIGCGNHSGSGSQAWTAAPGSTVGTPDSGSHTPPTPALQGAHGELVEVAAGRGSTLALRIDGEADPREVTDLNSLLAAGARLGTHLTLDAWVEPNSAGATGLAEQVRLISFTLDDVATSGRLEANAAGAVAFVAHDGRTFEPVGPLAAALLSQPLDAPLFVSGRLDANHQAVTAGAEGLEVTSFRDAVEVALRTAGGLLGYDARMLVTDVLGTGQYRFGATAARFAQLDRAGAGRLPESDRASIAALVSAADLRSQPTKFPGVLVMDLPTTTIHYADRAGEVTIEVGFQAQLPAEVDALLQRLQALQNEVPTLRNLERGNFATVTQARVDVARSAASFATLQTDAGSSSAHTVDFTQEVVVGAFRGVSALGDQIVIRSIERLGQDIYVELDRTSGRTVRPALPKLSAALPAVTLAASPSTVAAALVTRPYDLSAIATGGLTGKLFIDGQELPIRSIVRPQPTQPLVPVPALPPIVAVPTPRPVPPLPPVVNPVPQVVDAPRLQAPALAR